MGPKLSSQDEKDDVDCLFSAIDSGNTERDEEEDDDDTQDDDSSK